MQIDLSIRKLKALAKRLESDLSLSQAQRRRSLDALARGFGYDSYPALKAAVEAAQTAPSEDQTSKTANAPQPTIPAVARQLAGLPDRDLAGELGRRGYTVQPAPATAPGAHDTSHLKLNSQKLYRAMRDISDERGQEIMAAQGRFIRVEYRPYPEARPEVRELALVPQWLYLLFGDHAEAFETFTGIPADQAVSCNPDEVLDANGDLIDDLAAPDAGDGLRAAIARNVRAGRLAGVGPPWRVTLDDPDDADLREMAASGIESGFDRDQEMNLWRLDCEALETGEDEADEVRETIAGLVRQGFTSGYRPAWTLEIDEKAWSEDSDLLCEHIADLIAEGYTSGYHPRWVLHCALIA